MFGVVVLEDCVTLVAHLVHEKHNITENNNNNKVLLTMSNPEEDAI